MRYMQINPRCGGEITIFTTSEQVIGIFAVKELKSILRPHYIRV